MRRPVNAYEQLYRQMSFERAGLFRLVRDLVTVHCVLYPGSSVHITPSFFFSNVCYVDHAEKANRFFSDSDLVNDIINKYKEYNQDTRWRFINANFQNNLSVLEGTFDLIISLFSGRQIEYTSPYLRRGGYVLTSDEFSDHTYLMGNQHFELQFTIQAAAGHYVVKNDDGHVRSRSSKLHGGNRYVDNGMYFIYRLK